ncbi:MAG TPA: hypothetical protein VMT46_06960 [Anaerolineaceae bacterium]|nr:hypothetical protein [Anaerolineaceae bacterium]
MKLLNFLAVLLLIASTLAGCGIVEVGVETTPPPVQATEKPLPTQAVETAPASAPEPQASTTPSATNPAFPLAGLVYRAGDQLFRFGADGQPQSLAPGLDPQVLPGQFTPRAAVSPDGARMISWWDFSDLWLVDLKTGKASNLTNTADRVECCAQFWPARPDTVVFMSQPDATQGQSIGYPTLIKLDGSEYQVLDESSPSFSLAAPAPDGQRIAFDRAGEAWLYRGDGGLEPLNPAGYGLQDSANTLKLASPAWSADGKRLAWMAEGALGPNGGPGFAPVIFNLELKTHRLLAVSEGGGEGWPPAPLWSADGSWLATLRYSNDQYGMWIAGPDGSNEKQVYKPDTLRATSGLQAFWSSQSDQLLVIDPNASGGTRAVLIDAASGQPQEVKLPERAVPVAWPKYSS